jgi:uncharacterized protein (TIGR00251 family)
MAEASPEPAYVTRVGPGAWEVSVWVQPGARKNEVEGLRDGRLKVRVRAPAVENKANEALVRFMAEVLGLKARQVRLRKGAAARAKTLLVESERCPSWPAG